jgi:hypothetical protein
MPRNRYLDGHVKNVADGRTFFGLSVGYGTMLAGGCGLVGSRSGSLIWPQCDLPHI